MKPIIRLLTFLLAPTALSAGSVTIEVVDMDKAPVNEALVEYTFAGQSGKSLTGKDGTVLLSGNREGRLSLYVSKNGYYTTSGEVFRGGLVGGAHGKLVPLKAAKRYEVELKPVRDPVRMVSHRYRGYAPVSEEPLGYDLVNRDWIHPFGRGVTADLYFHFHDITNTDSATTGTLTLSFPNDGDGITGFKAPRSFSQQFGSNLTPPHEGPVEGYLPFLSWTHAHEAGQPHLNPYDDRQNYLIRTRTRLDEQGRILQACYGWIRGPVRFDTRDARGPQLVFEYFLNPSPDPENRSLEAADHPEVEKWRKNGGSGQPVTE